ncbi:MAG: DoxX family membrane protein [Bdellovibrionales bacterium]|nr:DoxX family membrane protein [Bdellovibrionales bacterium]
MFVAFFESIKYVGHLVPISFLRIYMGYLYLESASMKIDGDFLYEPRLAAAITEYLPHSIAPSWYIGWLESVVVPHWRIFAYSMTYLEFVIGVSFLVGFLVRPVALLGALLALNMCYISASAFAPLYELHFALFLMLGFMGAGRCLGFDYFFFKRNRGIWW